MQPPDWDYDKEKPQKGDVFSDGVNRDLTVSAVGNFSCFVTEETGKEFPIEIRELIKSHVLIERDGKPYKPERVFEEGDYLALVNPTTFKESPKKCLVNYSHSYPDHFRIICGNEKDILCPKKCFSWIGEKLPDDLWGGCDE